MTPPNVLQKTCVLLRRSKRWPFGIFSMKLSHIFDYYLLRIGYAFSIDEEATRLFVKDFKSTFRIRKIFTGSRIKILKLWVFLVCCILLATGISAEPTWRIYEKFIKSWGPNELYFECNAGDTKFKVHKSLIGKKKFFSLQRGRWVQLNDAQFEGFWIDFNFERITVSHRDLRTTDSKLYKILGRETLIKQAEKKLNVAVAERWHSPNNLDDFIALTTEVNRHKRLNLERGTISYKFERPWTQLKGVTKDHPKLQINADTKIEFDGSFHLGTRRSDCRFLN
jgi:hypothetical protein